MTIEREIKLVIYDCDGVMFESKRANVAFYNSILDKFGTPPIDENDYLLVNIAHTHTSKQVVDFLFGDDPRLEEVQEFVKGLDYTPFLHYMRMEPGFIEMLGLLKHNHYVAVATNRTTSLQTILRSFGLEKYFDYSITPLDVKEPKPHPESLFKILDHFQLMREEAIYIGDSEIDLETATRAGVRFAAYKNNLDTLLKIQNHLELKSVLGI
ncbi:MAG: HAD family hydrolase [Pseudomonadota bacterium]